MGDNKAYDRVYMKICTINTQHLSAQHIYYEFLMCSAVTHEAETISTNQVGSVEG